MMLGARQKKGLFWLALLALWLLPSPSACSDNSTRAARFWHHHKHHRRAPPHRQGSPISRPPSLLDSSSLKSRSVVYRNYYYYNPFLQHNQTHPEVSGSTSTSTQKTNSSEAATVVQYKFAYYNPEGDSQKDKASPSKEVDGSSSSDAEATEKVDGGVLNQYVTIGLVVGVLGFLGAILAMAYMYVTNPPTEVVTARGGGSSRLVAALLMAAATNDSSSHHLASLIQAAEDFGQWNTRCKAQVICQVHRRYSPVITKMARVMDRLFRVKWMERWAETSGNSGRGQCGSDVSFPDCPRRLRELLS